MRQALAQTITAFALLVASASWVGLGLLHTALDTQRSERVAGALLSDEAVRDQLRANVASAAIAALPASTSVDRAQVEVWADRVLESPVLELVVGRALVSTHAAFLGEGEVPAVLDLSSVIEEAHDAAVAADPALANGLPVPSELVIDLPTGQVPDVGWLRRGLERFVPVGAVLAAIGLLLALFVASHRPSILRRAGYWAIGAAATWLFIGVGIPWMATRLFAGQAVVAGALVDALAGGMIAPAIWLAAGGAVVLVGSILWLAFDPVPSGSYAAAPSQPITLVIQTPPTPSQVAPPPPPALFPPPPPTPPPTPPPPPPPPPPAPPVHTPAPPWIEGIGYVDPVPSPRSASPSGPAHSRGPAADARSTQ